MTEPASGRPVRQGLSSLPPRRLCLSVLAGLVALVVAVVTAPWLATVMRGPAANETTLGTLDVYGTVPPFSLTEQSGRPIGRDDLSGKVWLANFVYTHCTDTCPTQSAELARLQVDFADAPDLRLVSITVDPQHDTPAVLAQYAGRYGADRARWLFLTGDKREIYCLAQGLKLSVVDPSDPSPPACRSAAARAARSLLALLRPRAAFATHGSEGLVMHSARLVLIDRTARIRAYHLATDEDSLAQLRRNLRALLGERAERR